MTTVEAFRLLLQGNKIHCPTFANYLMIVGDSIKLFSKRRDEERKPSNSFSILMDQLERTDWEVWESVENKLIKRLKSDFCHYRSSSIIQEVMDYLEKKDLENQNG
jgi:hypothetical protein